MNSPAHLECFRDRKLHILGVGADYKGLECRVKKSNLTLILKAVGGH